MVGVAPRPVEDLEAHGLSNQVTCMSTKSCIKSLLISGLYFPPQVGGISHFMGAIASALGPDQICCLTSVPTSGRFVNNNSNIRVYRRPLAFAQAQYIQAPALA